MGKIEMHSLAKHITHFRDILFQALPCDGLFSYSITAILSDTILKLFICRLKKYVSTMYLYGNLCGKKLPCKTAQQNATV